MAKFVVIAGFMDQGIRNVKETVSRAEAFKEMAKKSGVTVKDMYWTLGRYDVIAICEAPDDEAATALSLSVCSRGNVRSQTLRAFSFDEMKTILGKMELRPCRKCPESEARESCQPTNTAARNAGRRSSVPRPYPSMRKQNRSARNVGA